MKTVVIAPVGQIEMTFERKTKIDIFFLHAPVTLDEVFLSFHGTPFRSHDKTEKALVSRLYQYTATSGLEQNPDDIIQEMSKRIKGFS
jgi:hypothetical protein